jgi:hypothetical protein
MTFKKGHNMLYRSELNEKTIGDTLVKHRGVVAHVIRELKISRETFNRRTKEFPNLITIMNHERDNILDCVEEKLFDEALNGNVAAQTFILRTQGKFRGWSERVEITGANGGAIALDVFATALSKVYGTDNDEQLLLEDSHDLAI